MEREKQPKQMYVYMSVLPITARQVILYLYNVQLRRTHARALQFEH